MEESKDKVNILPSSVLMSVTEAAAAEAKAPLLQESKEDKKDVNEPVKEPAKQREEDMRFPDPIMQQDFNAEPDVTTYRWFILASYATIAAIAGAMCTYYNFLEVILVDVSCTHPCHQ